MAEHTATAEEFEAVGASPHRARSLARHINSLDARIRDRYVETVKAFYTEYGRSGYELDIGKNGSFRTAEEQNSIRRTGVKSASPPNTWHLVGGAADFAIVHRGKLDEGNTANHAYATLLAPIAKQYGLTNPIRGDVGHFMPVEFPLERRGHTVADYISGSPQLPTYGVDAAAELRRIPNPPVDERVRRLQETLSQHFGLELDADGRFGAQTEAAVRTLQRTLGQRETGVVDEATWAHLDPLMIDYGTAVPLRPPRQLKGSVASDPGTSASTKTPLTPVDPNASIPRPRPDLPGEPDRSGALATPKTIAAASKPAGRSVVDEIDEIRRKMRSDRRAYFANEALQARYRELIALEQANRA